MESMDLRPVMSFKLYRDEKCFGPGVARLLMLVERTKSLRAAAQSMEMAYSKAWNIIKSAECGLGFKLLSSTTGGKGGGGAVLTADAKKLMEKYKAFDSEAKAAVRELFEKYFQEYK